MNLRWSDIDFERRFLLLPDSKTGATAVYLSEAGLRIVRDIQPRGESPYLFPGKRASEPLRSIRVPWEHICKAARLNNLRLHDLRHSFASVGAAGGLSLPMIGALLGHPAEHNRALCPSRRFAKSVPCRACHFDHFQGDSSVPRLAGQQHDYLINMLMDFRNHTRANNPAMSDLMSSVTLEQIEAIANYLAGL